MSRLRNIGISVGLGTILLAAIFWVKQLVQPPADTGSLSQTASAASTDSSGSRDTGIKPGQNGRALDQVVQVSEPPQAGKSTRLLPEVSETGQEPLQALPPQPLPSDVQAIARRLNESGPADQVTTHSPPPQTQLGQLRPNPLRQKEATVADRSPLASGAVFAALETAEEQQSEPTNGTTVPADPFAAFSEQQANQDTKVASPAATLPTEASQQDQSVPDAISNANLNAAAVDGSARPGMDDSPQSVPDSLTSVPVRSPAEAGEVQTQEDQLLVLPPPEQTATLPAQASSTAPEADRQASAPADPGSESGTLQAEPLRVGSLPKWELAPSSSPQMLTPPAEQPAALAPATAQPLEPGTPQTAPETIVENTPQALPPAQLRELPTSDEQPAITGSGEPGPERLEGPQQPQLLIEKIAPEELQVGEPAELVVRVANAGQLAAEDVEIVDRVPKGTKLLDTEPAAAVSAEGDIVWRLGSLLPGQQKQVKMHVIPLAEGEIGSVATVRFSSKASVRARVTKPELSMRIAGPDSVLIGKEAHITLTITNPGSGSARNVLVLARLPEQLQHPAGKQLVYDAGDLQPGESRQVNLVVQAERAGRTAIEFSATAGKLGVSGRLPIEVLAPQLKVSITGPKLRYLEREAAFEIHLSNPGTAPAKNVTLEARLPAGLEFVAANNGGYFDAGSRTVVWGLEELPAGEVGSVRLTVVPIDAGDYQINCQATADMDLTATAQHEVKVEGIAALLFQVMDLEDPVELGTETGYEIRVVNQGTREARDIRLTVTLPAELKPIAAEGPVDYQVQGNRIVFAPLPMLSPRADVTYRVRVQAIQAGDVKVRVDLISSDISTPVSKEESTRIYSDK